MKTAREMKIIQKKAIRDDLECRLIHMAKNKYTSYCCSSSDCPGWLQEELIRKGFKVENNNDNYEGITIYW